MSAWTPGTKIGNGDKVSFDDKEWAVVWSSDEMTDEERYESHMRTADFMEQYGLSGALQRQMAQQYRKTR